MAHPAHMYFLASLFNLGGFDAVLIILVVLLLFGARRLPGLARGVSQAIREFTRGKDDPVAPEPPVTAPPVVPAKPIPTMPVASKRP